MPSNMIKGHHIVRHEGRTEDKSIHYIDTELGSDDKYIEREHLADVQTGE